VPTRAKRQPRPAAVRFWEMVEKTDSCWLWKGKPDTSGYGRFSPDGRPTSQGAHRVSWQWFRGPIPDDMSVLHRCDVPLCVNPDHLFLGTRGDNNRDRAQKGRNGDVRGEKVGTSRLTAHQVVEIRRLLSEKVSQYEIADRFGVSQMTVSRIHRRESWAHLQGPS
jgi:hypothetical protein